MSNYVIMWIIKKLDVKMMRMVATFDVPYIFRLGSIRRIRCSVLTLVNAPMSGLSSAGPVRMTTRMEASICARCRQVLRAVAPIELTSHHVVAE